MPLRRFHSPYDVFIGTDRIRQALVGRNAFAVGPAETRPVATRRKREHCHDKYEEAHK